LADAVHGAAYRAIFGQVARSAAQVIAELDTGEEQAATLIRMRDWPVYPYVLLVPSDARVTLRVLDDSGRELATTESEFVPLD
jgi:hypothetical protein